MGATTAARQQRQSRIDKRNAEARNPNNAGLYGLKLIASHGHLLGKAKLPYVTGQQYSFAIAIARGAGPREAYRAAYPSSRGNITDMSAAANASRLLSTPAVLAWIDYHQRNEVSVQARTIPEHIGRLERLVHVCLDVGDTATAMRGEMAIGKVSGLYIERSISETNVHVSLGTLEDSLMSRNPALADRLKQARAIADSMDGDVKLLDLAPDVVLEPVPVSRNRDQQR